MTSPKTEIATLKDLKDALAHIPDETLAHLGCGYPSEGEHETLGLLYWATDETDVETEAANAFERHPVLEDIDRWIKALSQEQDRVHDPDAGDGRFARDSPISNAEYEDETPPENH